MPNDARPLLSSVQSKLSAAQRICRHAIDRYAAVSAETHHRASAYASPAAYSKGSPGYVYPEASPLSGGRHYHAATRVRKAIP